MQTVFAVSAATLFVPVMFHMKRTSEQSSLDPDAPGTKFTKLVAWLCHSHFLQGYRPQCCFDVYFDAKDSRSLSPFPVPPPS